jgi:hypothetical protein
MAWPTRGSFLWDADTVLIEYIVNFEQLAAGLFTFRHACGAVIAIKAEAFLDLCEGPFFRENKAHTSGCPGYCLYSREFRTCPNSCECASVRNLIPLITQFEKDPKPAL